MSESERKSLNRNTTQNRQAPAPAGGVSKPAVPVLNDQSWDTPESTTTSGIISLKKNSAQNPPPFKPQKVNTYQLASVKAFKPFENKENIILGNPESVNGKESDTKPKLQTKSGLYAISGSGSSGVAQFQKAVVQK